MVEGILFSALITVAVIAFLAAAFKAGKGELKFRSWRWRIDTEMNELECIAAEIREDIQKIFHLLDKGKVAGRGAPRLTLLGKTISKELSAQNWAVQTANELLPKVQGKEEFEVYEVCSNYVKNDFQPDNEQDKRVREVSYNHGIEPHKAREVLVIELRDQLLKSMRV